MKYVIYNEDAYWSQGPFHKMDDVKIHVNTLKEKLYKGKDVVVFYDKIGKGDKPKATEKKVVLIVVPLFEPK